MDSLRLYLFGSPRLERNGRPLEMDTRKALALLAVLALSGQEQQREWLAALFYPEADPDKARAAFRRTLSTLNRALGAGVLAARRDAVGLAPGADLWVDVLQFKSLLSQAPTKLNFEQAVSLYHDDFLTGFSLRDSPAFDDWQYQQSEDLRRKLDRALDQLASILAGQGDYTGAIQAAERRVRLDPLAEAAHRQLMDLFARCGQRNDALRQYRECVRILDQELGVSPLEETSQLYQEILSGKLKGKAPVESQPFEPVSTQRHPVISQFSPLVGREGELALLAQVLERAQGGETFIAVEGEAGVGKTRLAEEFLALAKQAGRVVTQARCYQGQAGLAYTPFMEGLSPLIEGENGERRLANLAPAVLAEASHLFPELPNHVKETLPEMVDSGPGAQTRFFEGLRQLTSCLLGGINPGVFFLDDLQWADSGTLDLLAFQARRLQSTGCILVAAWRSEAGPTGERLAQLVTELQRDGEAIHLTLARMNKDEIGKLAASRGVELPSAYAERLFQESEGLPFIALEYLNTIDQADPNWQLPGGVRALLHHRLQLPGEAARQLLTAGAVIGRSFNFNVLQEVSGRSDWETVAGLEELVNLGLILERGSSEYDFSHEKLRTVAYEEASAARLRLLHLRTGEALAASGHAGYDTGAWVGLAANHFLQGGQSARAAELFSQAGDQARRVHANSDALAAYQAALAAGHKDPAGLHEACGDLYVLLGNYREAVDSYQAAAAFCTPSCLSNLMHKLGEVFHRRGEWEAAEGHYRAALEAAGEDGSPTWLTHLFTDWSLTAYRSGQMDEARRLADQALQHALSTNDPGALAQAHNMLGILAHAAGALEEAGRFFEESLKFADQRGDPVMRYAAFNNLARLLQERDQADRAIPLARQALELCARMGDRHRQAAIQNNLADLYHAAGMEEEAMAELKQAVALFAEIGENAGSGQPEIWKLTEW